MTLLLYLATALVVLWLVHRLVRPLSRGAAVVLIALPLGITGPALVTGAVYGPIDHIYQYEPLASRAAELGIRGARNASAVDVWSEFFPWRLAVQELVQRGEWPLWKPHNLAGVPLAANAQSAPYSPFTLIACLLPAAVSMTYTATIALFLAAVCGFVLARELDCGEGAALIAAVGWGLASCIVLYTQTAMGFTTLYAPLLLAATRRVVRAPGIASGALLCITLVLQVVAGHPESLFLNVLVGAAFGVFELMRVRAHAPRAIATAVAAGIVALLLTAIFLLPLLEAIPQSIEYLVKSEGLADVPHGLTNERVLASLATNLFPYLHVRHWKSPALGYIGAETAAVGSLILALAVYAIWRRRSAETWFFAIAGAICILTGARWAPIADTLHALPLFDITLHDRLAFHGGLCLVVLAALGAEHLLRTRDHRAAAVTFAAVLVVLAIGTWWLQRNVVLAITPADYGRYRIAAELLFLAAAAAFLASRPRVVLPVLLTLIAGQRVLSEVDTFGTFPAAAAWPGVALFAPLETIREPFRLVGRGTALPPETNIFYGLDDPRGYEALTLAQFARTWKLWCRPHGIWFNRVDDLTAPFLSLMNVRFAMQPEGDAIPAGWRAIARDRGLVLLENANALARVFIPQRVSLTGASTEELVDRMAPVRDFRSMAWITSRDAPGERENGPGTIALREHGYGEYRFDADMQAAGFVVISDASWRGWQAFVDGKRVPLHRANAAFLAVHVPAGRHDVRVSYWPRSFVRGRAITLATLMLLIGVAALRRSVGARSFKQPAG